MWLGVRIGVDDVGEVAVGPAVTGPLRQVEVCTAGKYPALEHPRRGVHQGKKRIEE